MSLPILVIDEDTEIFNSQSIAWNERGFPFERVGSILEGIRKLTQSDYTFVAINGDNINYIPQLKIVRGITDIPIFIVQKDYTLEKHTAALNEGADALVQWADSDSGTVEGGLALLNRQTELQRRSKKRLKILCYKNLLLVIDCQQAFVNTTEIQLTRTEFDILAYLMLNRGRTLTHRQILRRIWNDSYDQTTQNILCNHIKNLRKKLMDASPECDYIKTKHSTGYIFQTQ